MLITKIILGMITFLTVGVMVTGGVIAREPREPREDREPREPQVTREHREPRSPRI